MSTQNQSSPWMSLRDGLPDAFDQAIAHRLALLGKMPVDTTSLEARLRAALCELTEQSRSPWNRKKLSLKEQTRNE